MTELLITEDDRVTIADFVQSGAYKKLLEYAVERGRGTCEAPSDRILFFQGIVAGVREFGRLIETYAKPPIMRENSLSEPFEKFRSKSGRVA